jgi:hypothetical protein
MSIRENKYCDPQLILDELRLNGPATSKQLAKALGLNVVHVNTKLIGMARDGVLTIFKAYDWCWVFGLADW